MVTSEDVCRSIRNVKFKIIVSTTCVVFPCLSLPGVDLLVVQTMHNANHVIESKSTLDARGFVFVLCNGMQLGSGNSKSGLRDKKHVESSVG